MEKANIACLAEEQTEEISGGKPVGQGGRMPRFDGTGYPQGKDWYDYRGHLYKVQKGDTFSNICMRFHLNEAAVRQDNWQIRDFSEIYEGMVIRLEAGGDF